MRVGLLFHPRIDPAARHAREVSERLTADGVDAWRASSWEVVDDPSRIDGSDLVVSFGGDGTLLRASRGAARYGVACIGVNYGRIGFLTDLRPQELDDRLSDLIHGDFWIEKRVLIDWRHLPTNGAATTGLAAGDVVVGRGRIARVVEVDVAIDGARLTTYTADGVIVATPTGSTGYTQAAGGPILHPESPDLVITPISPFLTPNNSLVVNQETTVELVAHTTHEITLSIDGQTERAIESGDTVVCRISEHPACYARLQPRDYFYSSVAEKLRWQVPREMPRPHQPPSDRAS